MASVDFVVAEFLLIVLVIVSLGFEVVLHRTESWLARRHADLVPALKIIYRELMVLGFISFLFIMYTTIFQPAPDIVHSFEFAHVFIFLLAVFYTFVVLFSLYASLRLSAHWKAMERIDVPAYVASKAEFTALRLRMHSRRDPLWRALQWWLPRPARLFRYRYLHDLMAYHDIRFQFIFYRDLPESFRFFSFLRKIKTFIFLKLVHTHWTLYIGLLIASAVDLVRRGLGGVVLQDVRRPAVVRSGGADADADDEDVLDSTDIVESAVYLAGGVALILLTQLLSYKIRAIYWQLTKNPRMYFADADADAPSSASSPGTSAATTPIERALAIQNPELGSPIVSAAAGMADVSGTAQAFDELEIGGGSRGHTSAVTFDGVGEGSSSDAWGGSRDARADNALIKNKSLAVTNATLAENRAAVHEHAEKAGSARPYPWVVRALLPRLTRVASPVEKMFWFGSHTFYFWCVQFVLFFATVLLSAVTSAVILAAVEGRRVTGLRVAGLVLAVCTLAFVLGRAAAIIKRYTFVLLNASLIPETMAAESIRSAERKRVRREAGARAARDGGSSGSESESGEDARARAEAAGETSPRQDGAARAQNGLRRKQTVASYMRMERRDAAAAEAV